MRKLLPLFFVITLCSCDKQSCKDCYRRWSFVSHTENQSGELMDTPYHYFGETEKFVLCDEDEIKSAEQIQRTSEKELYVVDGDTTYKVLSGAGLCECN